MEEHATALASPSAGSFPDKSVRSENSDEGGPGESRATAPPPGEGSRGSALGRDSFLLVRAASSRGRRPRGSTDQVRRAATRPIRAKTPPPVVSVRRIVVCGVEVKGSSSIRRQIYAQPICVIRASRSKVRQSLLQVLQLGLNPCPKNTFLRLTLGFTCTSLV
jgi:hypothetical protein